MVNWSSIENEIGEGGSFVRQRSAFRDRVSADGSTELPAEADRYHLYVSLACPWAHRSIIARRLKGLEDAIGMTILDPVRDDHGWAFRDVPGASRDPINDFRYLSEAYERTDPAFAGRITVPVLWDKREGRIVNNESADVIVMLDKAFDELASADLDLYPGELQSEIDELNAFVYDTINDGVYKCGFAASQSAYDHAFEKLFDGLDRIEDRLSGQRYLMGDRLTLADIRLFTTAIRFDAVYYVHFKCNKRRIVDYPNLWGWTRDLFQAHGIGETVDLDHIKRHYYTTHPDLNPKRIVPLGPDLDLEAQHEREALAGTPQIAS